MDEKTKKLLEFALDYILANSDDELIQEKLLELNIHEEQFDKIKNKIKEL